jgi:hypothetical protein
VLSPSALPSSPEEFSWKSEQLTTPQISHYDRTASKPSSAYSAQSERGPNKQSSIFSGRSSTYSQTSSGYQEFVFDSTSVYSGSQLSATLVEEAH